MSTRALLRNTRPGEYVRFNPTDTAPVWVRGGYDRSTKTVELRRFDDTNHTCNRKASTQVYVGFTF